MRICLNETDRYLSSAASIIQVKDELYNHFEAHFTVYNTTLTITKAPILLRHAYVGCMVQSGACESVKYYSIDIISESRFSKLCSIITQHVRLIFSHISYMLNVAWLTYRDNGGVLA